MALDAHKWAGTVAATVSAVITVAGFLITYWQGATWVFSELLRLMVFLTPLWIGLSVYGVYRFIRFQRELHRGVLEGLDRQVKAVELINDLAVRAKEESRLRASVEAELRNISDRVEAVKAEFKTEISTLVDDLMKDVNHTSVEEKRIRVAQINSLSGRVNQAEADVDGMKARLKEISDCLPPSMTGKGLLSKAGAHLLR